MKKVIIGSVISLSIFLSGGAQAEYMNKSMERNLIKVCEAIKTDSRLKLNRALKKGGFTIKAIGKGLVCNGSDPVTFAAINNAQNNAKYIAQKSNLDYDELLAKL